MKTSVYQAIAHGKIAVRDVTPDDLHPNDAGYKMLTEKIFAFMNSVY